MLLDERCDDDGDGDRETRSSSSWSTEIVTPAIVGSTVVTGIIVARVVVGLFIFVLPLPFDAGAFVVVEKKGNVDVDVAG